MAGAGHHVYYRDDQSLLHAGAGAPASIFTSFIALSILSVTGQAIAGVVNTSVSQKVIALLRKDIAARVLRMPIGALEQLRAPRIMAVLNNDIDSISAFALFFPSYVEALALMIGGFAYLLVLSPVAAGFAASAVAGGIVMSGCAHSLRRKDYMQIRAAQDDLQNSYKAITDGAKELRMNRGLREVVYRDLLCGSVDSIAERRIAAMRQSWLVDALGVAIFFFVIGGLIAYGLAHGMDKAVMAAAVIVLFFIRTPVSQLVSALPIVAQAHIAMKRIVSLMSEFSVGLLDIPLMHEKTELGLDFESVQLKDVTYAFRDSSGKSAFSLGPVDVHVRRGEVLFVTGKNGCGKTTLIKILLGLYRPSGGDISLNGRPVGSQMIDDYRQLFSVVFSDYYLFESFQGGCGARVRRERLSAAIRACRESSARKRVLLDNRFVDRRAQAPCADSHLSGGPAYFGFRRMGGGSGSGVPAHVLP